MMLGTNTQKLWENKVEKGIKLQSKNTLSSIALAEAINHGADSIPVQDFMETTNQYQSRLAAIINFMHNKWESSPDTEDQYRLCRKAAIGLKSLLKQIDSEMLLTITLHNGNEKIISDAADVYEEQIEKWEGAWQKFLKKFTNIMPEEIKKEYFLK